MITPPNFDIDTKNDALENVSPFKHGYDLGIFVEFTRGDFLYLLRADLNEEICLRTLRPPKFELFGADRDEQNKQNMMMFMLRDLQ